MGGFRRTLVRLIRYFVLKPAALFGWLAGLVALVAVVLLVPIFAASIPGVASCAGQCAALNRGLPARQPRLQRRSDVVSLSDDAQARLRNQGGSLEGLQQQMEAAKSQGIKLEEVSYVGGKSLPDGTSMQFYLVGVRLQQRSDIDYQPYMFTLDRDGKIAKVQ